MGTRMMSDRCSPGYEVREGWPLLCVSNPWQVPLGPAGLMSFFVEGRGWTGCLSGAWAPPAPSVTQSLC